ncbi:phosphatase PAP2 family protein [Microbacterium dauci]|uniref:Phosphatase PAP2 family protein n=1 Tax=Microbacterium dauci TaxID=3048008 RepID=A0ABT6ZGG1_9MICO|nr:phosphatase PAP2 family protein [Microbacterium sp. LX3-4]MDJ1114722.1 phosphatase PAP2 family protein [Microbacterium sp. LX3-4]
MDAQAESGRLRRFHERFLIETREVSPRGRAVLYATAAVLMVGGVAAFLVVLDAVGEGDDLAVIDGPIRDWFTGLQSPPMTVFMAVIATVFGPIAMPVIVLVTTVWWGIAARHAWRPLLLAGGMAVGVAIVQILAPIIGRERPPIATMLMGADHTPSFPSGHVMGATDFLLLTAYLVFSRRRNPVSTVVALVVAVVLVVLTASCRIYLGYHWPTDVLASLSLSMVVVGAVVGVDTWRTVRVVPEVSDPTRAQRRARRARTNA